MNNIMFIKSLLNYRERYLNAEALIKELRTKIEELQNKKVKAEDVIKEILNHNIDWYNWEELEKPEKEAYIAEAQKIATSKTYENEINHSVSDLIQEIAKESQDFNNVLFLRATINGIELLKERLLDIKEIPHKESTFNEPFNAL